MEERQGDIEASTSSKGGRPTKYDPGLCDELVEFFDVEPWSEMTRIHPKTGLEYTERVPAKLPTLEGFARHIGVAVSTLYNWKETHPEFLEACTHAQGLQKEILVQNGLQRLYDTRFTMFMAVNNTDLADVKERRVRVGDLDQDKVSSGMSEEELEAIAAGRSV